MAPREQNFKVKSTLNQTCLREVKECIRDEMKNFAVDRASVDTEQVVNSLRPPRNTIRLCQRLTELELKSMRSLFPELEFEIDGRDDSGHYLARAVRHLTLESFKLAFCVNPDLAMTIQKGRYHYLWKDIGSNPMSFMKMEIQLVHHCVPTTCIADAFRASNFNMKKAQINPSTLFGPKRAIYDNWMNPATNAICTNKSQHCFVRAPYMTFIHSTYDITIGDLVAILDRAETQVALGVIIFDPLILLQTKGRIESIGVTFRRFKRGMCEYIRFSFDEDSQNGYEHNYQTYIALVSGFVFRSRETGAAYAVSIDKHGLGHAFFRIVRIMSEIPRSVPFRVFNMGKINYKVIHTYDYINDPVVGSTLKRVRMVIPTYTYERLYTHAMTLNDGKFILKSLFVSACAFNQRIVVNGVSVTTPLPLPVEDLIRLCVSIYILCYDSNYNSMATLNELKDDIHKSRDGTQSMDYNFLKATWNLIMGEQHVQTRQDEFMSFRESATMGETMLAKATAFLKLLLGDRRYPIKVEEPVRQLEIEEEIAAVLVPLNNPTAPYKLLTLLPEPKNKMDVCTYAVDEEPELLIDRQVEILHQPNCLEHKTYTVVPTPGDGDCLFHAIRLTKATNMSVEAIRNYIATDPILSKLDREALIPNGPVRLENWGTDVHLASYARLSGLTFCLHDVDTNTYRHIIPTKSNQKVVFHIQYSNNHWSALTATTSVKHDIVHFNPGSTEKTPTVTDTTEDYFEKLFTERNLPKKKFTIFRDIVNPLDSIGAAGYLNRSALKLMELDIMGYIPDVDLVFDIAAGPGGFSQYLLEHTNAKIFALTKHIPINPKIVNDARFTEILPSSHHDISDDVGCDSYLTALRKRTTSKFPLVLADGCVGSPFDYTADKAEANAALKTGELRFALAILQDNGVFIQKLFQPTHPTTIRHLLVLVNSFESLDAVFLRSSHKSASEFFIVATFKSTNSYTLESTPFRKFLFDIGTRLNIRREYTVELLERYLCDPNNDEVIKGLRASVVEPEFLELCKLKAATLLKVGGAVPKMKDVVGCYINEADNRSPVNLLDGIESFETKYYLMKAKYFSELDVYRSVIVRGVTTYVRQRLLRYHSVEWENYVTKQLYLDLNRLSCSVDSLEPTQVMYYESPDADLGIGRDGYGRNLWGKILTYYFMMENDVKSESSYDTALEEPVEEVRTRPGFYSINWSNLLKTVTATSMAAAAAYLTVRTVPKSSFLSDIADSFNKIVTLNVGLTKSTTFTSTHTSGLSCFFSLTEKPMGYYTESLFSKKFTHLTTTLVTTLGSSLTYYFWQKPLLTLPRPIVDVKQLTVPIIVSSTIAVVYYLNRPTELFSGYRIPIFGIPRSILDYFRPTKPIIPYFSGVTRVLPLGITVFGVYLAIKSMRKIVQYTPPIEFTVMEKPRISPTKYHRTLCVDSESIDDSKVTREESTLKGGAYSIALKEYLDYCIKTRDAELSNHERILSMFKNHPTVAMDLDKEPGGYAVISPAFNPLTPMKESYNNYRTKYHEGQFVPVTQATSTPAVLSEYSRIALESDIIKGVTALVIPADFPDTGLVQAGPGTGKTTTIIAKAARDSKSLIVCSTVQGKVDITKRLTRILGREPNQSMVRTMASVLVNGSRNREVSLLLIDEGLMQHPGAVVATIAIMKPRIVEIYGDQLQIPFVNRLGTTCRLRSNLADLFPVKETLSVSHRCPPDVVARIATYYKEKTGVLLRSSKNLRRNTCTYKKFISADEIPRSGVLLTFTQVDKEHYIGRGYQNVHTIHEFQGDEAEDVIVVRTSRVPTDEIYLRMAYAIVAISRHTKSLVYYSPIDTDALAKLILKVPSSMDIDAHFVIRAGKLGGLIELNNDLRTTARFEKNKPASSIKLTDLPDFPSKFSMKSFKAVCTSLSKNVVYDISDIAKKPRILQDVLSAVAAIDKDRSMRFYSSEPITFHHPVVDDILIANGIIDCPNSTLFTDDINKSCKPYLDLDVNENLDLLERFSVGETMIQLSLFDRFGSDVLDTQALDTWMVHTEPLELFLKDCKMTAKGVYRDPAHVLLDPELMGPSQLLRPMTQIESVLAAAKRNFSVPDTVGSIDILNESRRMCDALFETYTDIPKDYVFVEPVTVSSKSITDWLTRQRPGIVNKLDMTESLTTRALNEYEFTIKRQPKPLLDEDASKHYPALQTILHHHKHVNVIFCSIFNELKQRLKAVSKDNHLIMTDCSPAQFCLELQRLFPADVGAAYKTLEMDFSKFDKSQAALVLEFELEFMRRFGVNEVYLELWKNAHTYTRARDPGTGLSFAVAYQRKTGDASTFFFNTLFVMGMMAHYFHDETVKPTFSLFAGDDSLLFFPETPRIDSQEFAYTYNMELKTFTYTFPHFCSKFLINLTDRWVLVPDPVKLCVKLARRDLRNAEHVEMYRISCLDLTESFRNRAAMYILGLAVRERYNVFMDGESFAASYCELTEDPKAFQHLYYSEFPELIDNTPLALHYTGYSFD